MIMEFRMIQRLDNGNVTHAISLCVSLASKYQSGWKGMK